MAIMEFYSYFLIWAVLIKDSTSRIGCYRCMSTNRSNLACEDPFNAMEVEYVKYCKGMKRNRDGVFPAQFCVKLYGLDVEKNETVMIRECTTEDLGVYKGSFKLNKKDVWGIVTTCKLNGCNSADHSIGSVWIFLVPIWFCAWLR